MDQRRGLVPLWIPQSQSNYLPTMNENARIQDKWEYISTILSPPITIILLTSYGWERKQPSAPFWIPQSQSSHLPTIDERARVRADGQPSALFQSTQSHSNNLHTVGEAPGSRTNRQNQHHFESSHQNQTTYILWMRVQGPGQMSNHQHSNQEYLHSINESTRDQDRKQPSTLVQT